MPEQQYKREIEEILRLADESEDPDLVDISYDDQFSVFQYYFLKMKENLRISFWPFSSGLILLVSLITLVFNSFCCTVCSSWSITNFHLGIRNNFHYQEVKF